MRTFEEARQRLPACCLSAFESLQADSKNALRIEDLRDAVEHEMTMYAENQDGCITAKERSECSRYLVWLDKLPQPKVESVYKNGEKIKP